MTLFGWDISHYDWDRGPVNLAAAKADGITFVTHKIGEGSGYTDPRFDEFWPRAIAAGFEFVGAYYVNHSANPAGQADRAIALADRLAPGWRTMPGFFWQADAERWPDDFPSPAACEAFCDRLAARSGHEVVLYASRGQYGNTLANVDYPLWNASYGSNPVGHYQALYPGDGSSRWAAYSGQTPVLLQYGSRARIGTQGTCDANAFRGSMSQLRALITGGEDVTDFNQADPNAWAQATRIEAWSHLRDVSIAGEPQPDVVAFKRLLADMTTVKSTLAAIAATGTSADAATILEEMRQIAEADRARDEAHAAELAELRAQLADRSAELARLREFLAQVRAGLADVDADVPQEASTDDGDPQP